ncbi:MAG: hypothetical protein ACQEQC_02045 [Elusimicrobiota bacterium]
MLAAPVVRSSQLSLYSLDSRVMALGGAGAALENLNSSLSVNPGEMARRNHYKYSLFYKNIDRETHIGYSEYILPLGSWVSIGAGTSVNFTDMDNYLQIHRFGLGFDILKVLSFGVSPNIKVKETSQGSGEVAGIDGGILLSPLEWLNIGVSAKNINYPEMEFENVSSTVTFPGKIKGGINIFYSDYFNIVADVLIEDFREEYGEYSLRKVFGIEIFPFKGLALRGGMVKDEWQVGLGINSPAVDLSYSYNNNEIFEHSLQYTRKFGIPPSIQEKEIQKKEEKLSKDKLYLKALTYYNNNEIARARAKKEEYVQEYGADERINELKQDINRWLAENRKEKLEQAEKLESKVLEFYYQGRIDDARKELENIKVLAPEYGPIKYLEHLLRAQELLEEGEYSAAEQELVEALKLNPDSDHVPALHRRLQEVLKLRE